MITRFEEMKTIRLPRPAVLAVAAAEDEPVIEAILAAKALGLVTPILYGDETRIRQLLGDASDIEIVPCASPEEAAHLACQAADEGRADMILKGLLETKTLLKEVLSKDFDLKRSPV